MSPVDYKSQRMSRNEARKRIAEVLNKWPDRVYFTKHAREELAKDGLTTTDAWNVLKSGSSKITEEGEFRGGGFTYRLATNYLTVVVSFEPDGRGLNVITGWDKRKGSR